MQKTEILPKKAIDEFAKIYFEQIGIKLSFEEAKIKAEGFIKLFDLVAVNNQGLSKSV